MKQFRRLIGIVVAFVLLLGCYPVIQLPAGAAADNIVELETGDQVVIFAPAYNKALTAETDALYQVGIDVTLSNGELIGYDATSTWSVTKNPDGTYSFANGGKNIAMAATFTAMKLDEVNDDWIVESLGDTLFNIKNVGRGNYMEWYAPKNYWGTYAASNAATDDQFQLSIYVIGKGLLGAESQTTEQPSDPPEESADPDGTVLTLSEANEIGAGLALNTYTETKYSVTGVITSVTSTTYGNMYIKDDTGVELYVYGMWDSTGNQKYGDLAEKPVVGDTVTLLGAIGNDNGSVQMKNGWITDYTTNNTSEAEPKEPPSEGSVIESGTCGDNLTWTLDDAGTLTISGTGPMANYSGSSARPWHSQRERIEKVVVSDGVTTIGINAFAYCRNMVSVVIPNSVNVISDSAFYVCDSLKSITIPDSVTTIGERAFAFGVGLTNVTIPDSVTTIGDYAFYGCSDLTEITIPNSVTTIGDYALAGCDGLSGIWVDNSNPNYSNDNQGVLFNKDKTVLIQAPGEIDSVYTIPDSVTTIGNDAFRGCDDLSDITISNGVASIGDWAFSYCTGLTSVTIPASVTIIGDGAFGGCTRLTGIWVDNNNLRYSHDSQGVLFNKDKTVLVQAPGRIGSAYTIPDSVTTISAYSFANCTHLTSVTMGDNVTVIDKGAFYCCTELAGITIPGSVTTIGIDAFYDCDSLTSITIPKGITSIGDWAFDDCDSLTDVYITDPSAWCKIDFGDYNATILSNGLNLHILDKNGNETTQIVLDSTVTEIPAFAFYFCERLTSVTIPDSVTTIGDRAFEECSNLTDVVIGDSVTTIGESAFVGCENLTGITIPDSVAIIGNWAFERCSNLSDVKIGDSVTVIGESAFVGCESLTAITIPDSITTIGDRAFEYCYSLTDVVIGDSVTNIGESAFGYCESLNSITIPASLTTIGEDAFIDCYDLTDVYITDPSAWCKIRFGNNNSNPLSSYSGNVHIIDTDGNEVTQVVLDSTVTAIPDFAFQGCSSLTHITIPDSVTTIGKEAFDDCSNLNFNYYDNAAYLGNSNNPYMVLVDGASGDSTSCNIHVDTKIICNSALLWYSGLESVSVPEKNAYYSTDSNGVLFNKNKTELVRAPGAISGSYTIPNGVVTIGTDAFSYCTDLISVIIPNSVTTIGEYAFEDSGITEISMGSGIATIHDNAFFYCSSLNKVHIKDIGAWCEVSFYNADSNPLSYGADLYLGDERLTHLVIPEGVTFISDSAFFGCTSLTKVTIPGSVTTIGDSAFLGCENLIDLTISDGVQRIGNDAFSSTGLTHLTIPSSVTEIWGYAFYDCYELISLTLKTDSIWISWAAFEGCDKLSTVFFYGTEEQKKYLESSGIDGNNDALISAKWHYEVTELMQDGQEIYKCGKCGGYYQTDGSLVIPNELSLIKLPEKLSYLVGETVSVKGISLRGMYADGGVVFLGADAVEYISADLSTPGKKVVTIEALGNTFTFDIYVHEFDDSDVSVILIDSARYPYPESDHDYGDSLNETKTFTYPGATSLIVTFSEQTEVEHGYDKIYVYDGSGIQLAQYTGYDAAGKTLTITGDTFKIRLTSDDSVNAYGYSFSSIQAKTGAVKLLHDLIAGEATPPTATEQGYTTYYCSYGCGYTEQRDFTTPGSSALTGITIATLPNKTEYWVGESLDTTGLTLTATYSDGSTETVTEGFAVSGFDSTVTGSKTITVTYEGCTATFLVSVVFGGTCGDNLTWILDDAGTLTISGIGAMEDCGQRASPWYNYVDEITEVTVENGVTTIGDFAFFDCYYVTKITIPESVTTIGQYAFAYCEVSEITIPDSVTTIGDYAFFGCSWRLKSVTLTSNIRYIGKGPFAYCTGLTGILVDENNPYYCSDENGVLFDKAKTKLLQMPGGFSGAYAIPDTVTAIGASAFAACDGLTEITIPESVTEIGEDAFRYCEYLTEITIPGSVETVGDGAFSNCFKICNIAIEQGVKTIGANAFSGCTRLGSITLPNSVTKIGSGAFDYCTSLTEIVIPEKVTTIQGGTFLDCGSLTSVTIPSSVTSIGIDAFSNCGNLKDVYYGGTAAQWSEIVIGEENEPLLNATLHTVEPTLTGITVKTQPTKTEYWVGESLDTTGLTLTATYSDGSTETVTEGYTISGFTSATAGTKTVTVAYEGKTATFTVQVKEAVPDENAPKIIVGTVQGVAGIRVSVDISLEKNPGIVSATLQVDFDDSVLTLVEVQDKGVLGSATHKPEKVNPYILRWVNNTVSQDYTVNGAVVTLVFEIKEGAGEGTYPISVSYDYNNYDIMNWQMDKVQFSVVNGSVTVIDVVPGDVNGDGNVDNRDSMILDRYLAKWDGYTVDVVAADVNGDGSVNNLDSMILARYLAKWEGYETLPYTQKQ